MRRTYTEYGYTLQAYDDWSYFFSNNLWLSTMHQSYQCFNLIIFIHIQNIAIDWWIYLRFEVPIQEFKGFPIQQGFLDSIKGLSKDPIFFYNHINTTLYFKYVFRKSGNDSLNEKPRKMSSAIFKIGGMLNESCTTFSWKCMDDYNFDNCVPNWHIIIMIYTFSWFWTLTKKLCP